MRILYVTNNSHLRSTSAMLNAVVRRLHPRGLRPVMLFREPGPWQQQLAADGFPCFFHPLRLLDKRWPLRSFADLYALVRLVRRNKIDLIHCNEHDHYPLLRYVARWTRIPIILTFRFIIEEGFAKWAFRRPYTPDYVQFTSKSQQDYCQKSLPAAIGPDRQALMMNGLDVEAFLSQRSGWQALRAAWGATDSTVVLGTASALRPRKQLEDFISLIGQLRKRSLPVLGVIAGGGKFADSDYVSKLESLIAHEKLEGKCLLLGNIDPIAPFMQALDLFVSTSQWETFGMSVCEAMACGKPAIGYEAGSVAEVMHDPWFSVPTGDLETLVEKCCKLAMSDCARVEEGNKAAQFVRENFDAPVLAARQAAIYEEILGRSLDSGASAVSRGEFQTV